MGPKKQQPAGKVVHDLANKMTIIAGHCDLLAEMVDPHSELARRVQIIREAAHEGLRELQEHQRKEQSDRLAG